MTEEGVVEKEFLTENPIPDEVLENCLVFPSFVDLHVHLRQDTSGKWNYKSTFRDGADAALRNGITRLLDMPNTPHPVTDKASLQAKKTLLRQSYQGPVRIHLYAGIGPDTEPIPGHEFYKLFMAKSVGELYFTDWSEMDDKVAEYAAQPGVNISFHCEDPKILAKNAHKDLHWKKRPAEAEVSAIRHAIGLCRKYRFNANICHVSTIRGMEMIMKAKEEGLPITAEVSPGHLIFHDDMPDYLQKHVVKNPPIRTDDDRQVMLAALEDGMIDFIATDHAPHTLEEKAQSTPGLPYLEAMGPVITHLIKNEGLSPETIASAYGMAPRRFLGDTEVEAYTILDMENPLSYQIYMVQHNIRWSQFEHFTFPGRVIGVMGKDSLQE
ncbi:dihydroorotase family protein [Candidatus Woesearchaeota archaeon]|nr:dihydroorotase family protein [Candidatus Woesearchaeota archaeon]